MISALFKTLYSVLGTRASQMFSSSRVNDRRELTQRKLALENLALR
jgi:hypothetical protein